ncbi:MAG: hypothetical protein Q9M35_12175 [Rhodothermus sp.]|nr:hypothetical protein [Rhodothermus sp.]
MRSQPICGGWGLVFVLAIGLGGCVQDGLEPNPSIKLSEKFVFMDSLMYDRFHLPLIQKYKESFLKGISDYVVDSPWVYVSDGRTSVKIFDFSGNFVGLLGNIGEGVGEYMMPGEMFKCHDMIGVYDVQLRRFNFYKNGVYVSSFVLSFVPGGNLLEEPFCRNGFIYFAVRGYPDEAPYHLFQVDTTGRFVRAAFRMDETYRGYYHSGIFRGKIVDTGDKIAFAHSLYKKVFIFSYQLDSLGAEMMQMPEACRQWTWEPEPMHALDDPEAHQRQLLKLHRHVHIQAPCLFIDMYPYKNFFVYSYLYGPADQKIGYAIFWDRLNRKAYHLIGGVPRYVPQMDYLVAFEGEEEREDRWALSFFKLNLAAYEREFEEFIARYGGRGIGDSE